MEEAKNIKTPHLEDGPHGAGTQNPGKGVYLGWL